VNEYDLASEVEDRLYKIQKVLDLCMEYLGTSGGHGMDPLETTLWVVQGLAKDAEERFETYRKFRKERQDADKEEKDFNEDTWEDFDELLSRLDDSPKRDDAGKVGLAIQDDKGNGAGKKVLRKKNAGKSSTSTHVKGKK
jgi:hypothetical protein